MASKQTKQTNEAKVLCQFMCIKKLKIKMMIVHSWAHKTLFKFNDDEQKIKI